MEMDKTCQENLIFSFTCLMPLWTLQLTMGTQTSMQYFFLFILIMVITITKSTKDPVYSSQMLKFWQSLQTCPFFSLKQKPVTKAPA